MRFKGSYLPPALLMGGVALLLFGTNAASSFNYDLPNFFEGGSSDKERWMLIVGLIAVFTGLMWVLCSWTQLASPQSPSQTTEHQQPRFPSEGGEAGYSGEDLAATDARKTSGEVKSGSRERAFEPSE